MKKVSMKKVSEVLRFHFKLELSVRQSANAANVSRSTASDYCRRHMTNCHIYFTSFIYMAAIIDWYFPERSDKMPLGC